MRIMVECCMQERVWKACYGHPLARLAGAAKGHFVVRQLLVANTLGASHAAGGAQGEGAARDRARDGRVLPTRARVERILRPPTHPPGRRRQGPLRDAAVLLMGPFLSRQVPLACVAEEVLRLGELCV